MTQVPLVRSQTVPLAIPLVLSLIAGYIDSVTFIGLFGVYVAQLTGSFVLIGTNFFEPEKGLVIKLLALLALPAFFAAGFVATLLAVAAQRRALVVLMAVEAITLAALLAVLIAVQRGHWPISSIDSPAVMAAALVGIAAMGVQSAMVRLTMTGVASTNVMTTNTTQFSIDMALLLAGRWRGALASAECAAARARLSGIWRIVVGFVAGTVIGAAAYVVFGFASLAVPLAMVLALTIWAARRPRA